MDVINQRNNKKHHSQVPIS